MNDDEYKCSICLEVCTKGWSDAEATAELEVNFPGFTPEDCVLVCDDCYQKHMS